MVTCWAHTLGDCSNTQSREHYVSKGLFVSDGLRVRGLPWCRYETKTIGLGSATSKILCTSHNERLAELDAEAVRAFESFREIFTLRARQAQLPGRLWKRRVWSLNARLLERWFLKTFINLVQVQQPLAQWRGTSDGQPPIELVRATFGLIPIDPPLGLYAAGAVDHIVVSDGDTVAFAPLHHAADGTLAAGAFEFRGFRFVVKWTEADLNSFFRTVAFRDSSFAGWHESRLEPLKDVKFMSGATVAQQLSFKWPPFRKPKAG
jgi:hypothetical protein